MAGTYDSIATATASGSQLEILFTGISQVYTDLIIVISATESGSDGMDLRVGNGSIDSGNNYSFTWLRGNGSAASSYRVNNYSAMEIGNVNSTTSNFIVEIFNYSNTTTYKSYISRSNNTSNFVAAISGTWRSTSAINQISFKNGGGVNHGAGSTFTLYGIKAE
jgi:hypothetical protein